VIVFSAISEMFAVNPNAPAQNPPVFSLKTGVRVE
jgi:hypothetical protein